jgi:glycyl-tRNA synthetase beta chain
MKHNVLFEIGCEEIPARFVSGFLADLKVKTEEKLKRERLGFSNIITLGTSRRLVLFVENLDAKQIDLAEEIKGPPADISFDTSGKPKPAAIGFAKTQGVKPEELIVKPSGPKDYLFAKVLHKGQLTEKLLVTLLPEIISALYQPLAMRWGEIDYKFIRPIHWLLALYGDKIIKFELAGVKSGNFTEGHRYFKGKEARFELKEADLTAYKNKLKERGVIVDQAERKELIRRETEILASKQRAIALIEDDLLDEVTYLVELPKGYVGTIDKTFLTIPPEVLITSMKKNQKYFPLLDQGGKLIAKFIVITNGCETESVIEGNQKVLSARLTDAKFFFAEDQKIPLAKRRVDLEKVGYFEKLGTIAKKMERVAKLAEVIGKRLKLDEAELTIVRRIAELAKADLTTKMVYEFPELQGVMGKEYALLSGEDPRVALGIYEHYLPRFADDDLPRSKEGMVVALADRLDSLVGCFSVGSIPTGSVDPYGLRRAVNGIIRIILDKKLDLFLAELIEQSYKLYEPVFMTYLFEKGETGYQDFSRIKRQLLEFIAGRLKPILLEEGIRYDVVEAVLAEPNDILDCFGKAAVINRLVAAESLIGIVRSADRVARLSKEVTAQEINDSLLIDEAEKKLAELYTKVNWEVREAINREDWDKALVALARLTLPIEDFFTQVLVMHDDPKLKANRLALLKALANLYNAVADFRQIVIEGEKK